MKWTRGDVNGDGVYTKKTNHAGGRERTARTFEIRLSRDNVKAAWRNLDLTPGKVEKL